MRPGAAPGEGRASARPDSGRAEARPSRDDGDPEGLFPGCSGRAEARPSRDGGTHAFHSRRHPSRLSVLESRGNRRVLLFVTIATKDRRPLLADDCAHEALLSAWKAAGHWMVGRYVLMPEHVHFFCSPGLHPPPDFHKWMTYWKALAARAFWNTPTGRDALPRVRSSDTPRHPPLFQRDCWDTQLRTGDSYTEKWAYVRRNPVRKGLVPAPEDWPYQGELHVLDWHG